MNKHWYQIDRRQDNGQLDGYDMVQANNFDTALRSYLGDEYKDYNISKKQINGRTVVTAHCPAETSSYLEITRVIKQ